MKTTALWHTTTNQSKLQTEKLPDLKKDQVQIKSLYSLVSTGTERLVANGLVPEDLHEKMEVPYMDGTFNFPIKYGYSLVGEVISEGAYHGQLVHLLHPHQDRVVADMQSIDCFPKNIPVKRATLASNMETALNAIWDSGVSVGDKVLVVGFGMIGGLVSKLLSLIAAVEVVVIEPNDYRATQAANMGFSVNPSEAKHFDISFHTSGTSAGLQTCIDSIGMEGKVVELSWYGTKPAHVKLGGAFHYQRKQIISSQVAHIPFSKQARWNFRRRKQLVWELLKQPIWDIHITHEVSFDASPSFFEQLRTGGLSEKGIGWVIKYQ